MTARRSARRARAGVLSPLKETHMRVPSFPSALAPGNCDQMAVAAPSLWHVTVRRSNTDEKATEPRSSSEADSMVVRIMDTSPERACHRALAFASSVLPPGDLFA